MLNNPIVALIFLPILASLVCLALPDRLKNISRAITLMLVCAALAVSIYIFIKKPIIFQFNSSTIFLADNLSAFIGVCVALFAFLSAIYSFGFVEKHHGSYFGYFLASLGSSFGIAFANNFIPLIIFWGLLAVLLYLMINIDRNVPASEAAKKAFIIVGGTDALMIFGIVLICSITGTFAMDRVRIFMNGPMAYAAYFSILCACFAKTGVMPFHSWVPDAAQHAPTPVTAYLPVSLDKLVGIYLLLRVSIDFFVIDNITRFVLLACGAVTIVLGALLALNQNNMKRIFGYCAVSQVGYMVLGIGTCNSIGIAGSLFHMLNHAVYESCLFFSAGNVEKKAGSVRLSDLGGLAKYMPVTFVCFLAASLSISGIPPFNGFVSKWMIYQGILESAGKANPMWLVWLAAAMFGSTLTIAIFAKLIYSVFLSRESEGAKNVKEAKFLMLAPIVVLALLCVLLGVFAFIFPLPLFILPAIGVPLIYLGTWSPIVATMLILIGLIPGLFIYSMVKKGKFRTVPVFVGGEEVEKLDRVTGTNFYDTVKEMKELGGIYKKEDAERLDIYNVSRSVIYFFGGVLKRLHNGVLPTYLVWCLVGMLVMFLFVFFR